jgi:hypothetical protein
MFFEDVDVIGAELLAIDFSRGVAFACAHVGNGWVQQTYASPSFLKYPAATISLVEYPIL